MRQHVHVVFLCHVCRMPIQDISVHVEPEERRAMVDSVSQVVVHKECTGTPHLDAALGRS